MTPKRKQNFETRLKKNRKKARLTSSISAPLSINMNLFELRKKMSSSSTINNSELIKNKNCILNNNDNFEK